MKTELKRIADTLESILALLEAHSARKVQQKRIVAESAHMGKYDPDFDEVWKLWLNRKSKRQAFKAWLSARKRELPEVEKLKEIIMLQNLVDYGRREKQYVPMMSTWLNSDGWLNPTEEVEVEKVRTRDDEIEQWLDEQYNPELHDEMGGTERRAWDMYEEHVRSTWELIEYEQWREEFDWD